jgi:hypothetical protein
MSLFPQPLKPPRPRTAKTEMKAKIRWKGPAQQRHLLLRFLKILALTRRGSMSKSSLPRVPPLIKLWPGKPSHQRTTESSSISWTHECPSACVHILSFSCRLR